MIDNFMFLKTNDRRIMACVRMLINHYWSYLSSQKFQIPITFSVCTLSFDQH